MLRKLCLAVMLLAVLGFSASARARIIYSPRAIGEEMPWEMALTQTHVVAVASVTEPPEPSKNGAVNRPMMVGGGMVVFNGPVVIQGQPGQWPSRLPGSTRHSVGRAGCED